MSLWQAVRKDLKRLLQTLPWLPRSSDESRIAERCDPPCRKGVTDVVDPAVWR